jgi:hypothetical protein
MVAATGASSTCNRLTAQESTDKNYYIFTALVSPAPGATITGYVFNFGDNQSYEFNYGSTASNDRAVAVVNHTYESTGSYQANVNVITSTNGKSSHVSSAACTAKITIGPGVTTLPNTGPGNVTAEVADAAGVALVSTVTHSFVTKRRLNSNHPVVKSLNVLHLIAKPISCTKSSLAGRTSEVLDGNHNYINCD